MTQELCDRTGIGAITGSILECASELDQKVAISSGRPLQCKRIVNLGAVSEYLNRIAVWQEPELVMRSYLVVAAETDPQGENKACRYDDQARQVVRRLVGETRVRGSEWAHFEGRRAGREFGWRLTRYLTADAAVQIHALILASQNMLHAKPAAVQTRTRHALT